VALAIRDFSYLFTYASKLESFSTLSRFLVAASFIASVFVAKLYSSDPLLESARLALVFAFELLVVSYFRGLKPVVSALRIVVFFVAIGTTVLYSSYVLGWATPDPASIVVGAITLVALFFSFSLLFQLISLKEWRSILSSIGAKSYALLMTLVVPQIPVTIFYASEAFTTVKLKYGGKKLYKVIVPLVLLTVYNARSMFESHLLYGVSYEAKLTLFKRKDVLLYVVEAVLILAFTLLGHATCH